MCSISVTAFSMASILVCMGIGVMLGINWKVSVLISVYVSGL